jgi:hypothetical protein
MTSQEALHYVSVRDVQADLGTDDVTVETSHGRRLGLLDGFLVDSGLQSLRYFVVRQLSATSQTLARIPFVPARIDAEKGVLRLLDDAPSQALG